MTKKRARGSSPTSGWGGWRPGAGRKPAGAFAGVSHTARPRVSARHGVLVTFYFVRDLPDLRRRGTRKVLRAAVARVDGQRGFRVLHQALFADHLHLLVRARSTEALSHAAKSLCIRFARGLNAALRRRGRVFADRFEARVLRDERELRSARTRPCAWRLPPGTTLRNRPPSCHPRP